MAGALDGKPFVSSVHDEAATQSAYTFLDILFIKSGSKLIMIYPHLVDALAHPTQAD